MSVSLHTPVCSLLGCDYPIIQTAMGWVADARLVAAVGDAGGFGFLAAATLSTAQLEAEIERLHGLSTRPFGINFHMFQANAQQVLALIIKHRVRAASYGRGADPRCIEQLKQAGVVCLPTVGATRHALKAVAMGADGVIVQGAEGGGHTGAVPTSLLLPQVLDAVQVPVIAAGGLHEGRGLAAALAAGAQGIAMGTRFLLTEESPVPLQTLAHYLRVVDAGEIRVSSAVDGLPQRLIDNAVLQRLEQSSRARRSWQALAGAWAFQRASGLGLLASLKTALSLLRRDRRSVLQTLGTARGAYLISQSLREGRPEHGLLPSGQVAACITQLQSCAEVIDSIVVQATQRLAAVQGWMAPNLEVRV
ncbi:MULTISPECIES: nitronate monooxygenase family protein [unclassified Pseudomonas]|uniref:NAD(P)H-dependent flavin oxidoreductase n=1 Tax=unclassified Pseudomonas TaxID=196821 RepID=UPI000A1D8D8C|nr:MULTISPECIES: nitronate monooxygenase [unclassified Pseudomonas]